MTPTEQATIWGQIALAILTIASFVLKERSDRRQREEAKAEAKAAAERLAAELATREAMAGQDRKSQAQHLAAVVEDNVQRVDARLSENTRITQRAATQAQAAYEVGNHAKENIERMEAMFNALLRTQTIQQSDTIDHIDTTANESKALIEDIHDATVPPELTDRGEREAP